jgi:hypothetical protein
MPKTKYEKLISQLREKNDELNILERNKILDKFGLFEEVEVESLEAGATSVWVDGKLKYLKKVYENINDEELNEITLLNSLNESKSVLEYTMIKFNWINIVGYFYIVVGVLAGLILIDGFAEIGIAVAISSFIFGIFFLSVGHIIRQINIIINHLNKK